MTKADATVVVKQFIDAARATGRLTLSEPNGKEVLAAAGITVPHGCFVTTPIDVTSVCERMKFPLVVKGVSPELIHKTDAGAVLLNLADADAVRNACMAMQDVVGNLDGFLIEEMAPAGHEVIVGGIFDPQFGPVLMVGLGGVFVEVLADVAFRICPINRADAAAMLNELRAVAVLDGARGQRAASRDAIIDVLMRVGGPEGLLYRQQGEIAELDINPLIVSQHGAVAADARIVLRATPLPATKIHSRSSEQTRALFQPLFEPRNIAVIGASATRRTRSNTLIEQLLRYGFDRNKLYPIHPSAAQIDGLTAYASLADTPEAVDYAYIAVAAAGVAELFSQAKGRLKIAHVTSGGFAEYGRQDLQDELVAAAHEVGARVLGPNCNGGHSPRGKLTFCYDSAADEGCVGIVLQSGGLGVDVIRRGNHRGLRFSGVITVGNCADIDVVDLLDFYLCDPATQVIGMYLEGAPQGRRMFEQLVNRHPAKPVVILKGGRSERGRNVTVSHTGTLAGDDRIWDALCQQTGVVLATSLDDFIDKLLALQCVTARASDPTVRAVLLGNGGGTSVLGVDAFGSVGIDITPFSADTVAQLHDMGLGVGAAYSNPVDLPQPVLIARQGRDTEAILRIILGREQPQTVVVHINLSVVMSLVRGDDDPVADLVDAAVRVKDDYRGKAHFLLVLRSDGSLCFEAARIRYRAKALENGIPTYDELPAAANALAAIAHHENFLAR
jgi:acyl-CoA synthetase (NDP forming)